VRTRTRQGTDELEFDDFEDRDDFGDGAGWDALAGGQAEMNIELLGLKNALYGGSFEEGDEEEQVEEMGRMMSRLMAIKVSGYIKLSHCIVHYFADAL
jgi:hypothetical protein